MRGVYSRWQAGWRLHGVKDFEQLLRKKPVRADTPHAAIERNLVAAVAPASGLPIRARF